MRLDRLSKRLLPVLCALLAFLAACAAGGTRSADLAGKIDVFGVALYSDVDHKVLEGVKASREECVQGYEHVFDPLEVRIGYTPDGTVRALLTRNAATSVFGVRVGEGAVDAERRLVAQGFEKASKPYRFNGPFCRIDLLVDEKGSVFGVRAEAQEALL